MKRYLNLFLLFSSFLLLVGCTGIPTGYHSEPIDKKYYPGSVLGTGYKTLLYKAKINVFDRYFSGLFFFKKFEDQSYRIVFLSELGLNLLDLEYKNSEITVKNCQPFLKKESVLNTLKNDLGLLVKQLEISSEVKFYKGDKQPTTALSFETEESDYIYYYDTSDQLIEIQQDSGAFQGVQVKIKNYRGDIPEQIDFIHDWIDLNITLQLLKVKS